MKKRMTALFLAAILVFGTMTAAVSAATPTQVYNYLKQYAMAGESNSDHTVYKNVLYLSEDLTILYKVEYYTSDESLYLTYNNGLCAVALKLPKTMTAPYQISIWTNYGNGAGSLKNPGSYTENTRLSLDYWVGDVGHYADWAEQDLNQYFPTLLEYTYLVIYDGGYNLKDLGFTKFNRHTVHIYGPKTVTVPPTCVEKGTAVYTCRVCGATRSEDVPPTGVHTWDGGKVVTEPTCTRTGVKRYTCKVCKTATKDETIPALGHLWTFTEVLTEGEEGLHSCTGLYTCTRCGETKEAPLCAAEVFTDMPAEGNWAHDPIDWAYFNGITAGKTPTAFKPRDVVTRAEAMTFLWKTMNSPEPNAEDNPFTDVPEGKYFYKPVLWAVENGITSGATETTFAPKQKCTRAQIMMFIWAAAGRPEPTTEENPFNDVPVDKYYYRAVLWAVENGLTGGVGEGRFGPNQTCTRAQIVTFLYKAEALLNADPQPEPTPDPDPTPDPEPTPDPDPETP